MKPRDTSRSSEGPLHPAGRAALLIGVAVLAVGALVVVPVFVASTRSSRAQEVERTVERIRLAEIQHHEVFGAYVPAESAPRAPEDVDPAAVPWSPSEGFRKLAVAPERASVIGSYRVVVSGDSFTVIGTCDADGDGARAVFEATRDLPVHAVTEPGVY